MYSPDGLVDPSTARGSVAAEKPPRARTNRTAIVALGSIVGIWLGVYALNQIRVSGEDGRGLALAGIFVGSVTLLISMIVIVMGLSSW